MSCGTSGVGCCEAALFRAKLPAVDHRHMQIEDDDIRALLDESRESIFAILRDQDVIAAVAEENSSDLPHGRVVIDNEDAAAAWQHVGYR